MRAIWGERYCSTKTSNLSDSTLSNEEIPIRMNHTQVSKTVNENGCVVQRGFQVPTPTPSSSPVPESLSTTLSLVTTLPLSARAAAAPSHVRSFSLPNVETSLLAALLSKTHTRRHTWNGNIMTNHLTKRKTPRQIQGADNDKMAQATLNNSSGEEIQIYNDENTATKFEPNGTTTQTMDPIPIDPKEDTENIDPLTAPTNTRPPVSVAEAAEDDSDSDEDDELSSSVAEALRMQAQTRRRHGLAPSPPSRSPVIAPLKIEAPASFQPRSILKASPTQSTASCSVSPTSSPPANKKRRVSFNDYPEVREFIVCSPEPGVGEEDFFGVETCYAISAWIDDEGMPCDEDDEEWEDVEIFGVDEFE